MISILYKYFDLGLGLEILRNIHTYLKSGFGYSLVEDQIFLLFEINNLYNIQYIYYL